MKFKKTIQKNILQSKNTKTKSINTLFNTDLEAFSWWPKAF